MRAKPHRILAIASSGGHWLQLHAIAANLPGEVVFATTQPPPTAIAGVIHYLPDASKTHPLRVALLLLHVVVLLVRLNPTHVVTTGAAPGCLAVILGRLMGRRVVFVDSIANAEGLSLSGRIAARCGLPTLTQWPHLHGRAGARYAGDVFQELA